MRVEFLLEELSMKNVLEVLLPQILPPEFVINENYFLRPHNGKSDLQRSIPNKVRAFSRFYEPVKLVILHDQDRNDCKKLKHTLTELCKTNGSCPVLIRIPCQELEAWYLGDMDAIEKVYPRFKARLYRNKEAFRNPDRCDASLELKKIIPDFHKGFASREIPKYMSVTRNTSESFNQFISGITKFLT
jgi:hypothetical protein